MARHRASTPWMVWIMRATIVLNLLSTIGFIIFAVILQNPPKSALPLGLLIVGIIGAIAALIGLFASCFQKGCCMMLYLILGTLITLAELGITLAMFFGKSSVVENLAKSNCSCSTPTQDQLNSSNTKVSNGRWFFLIVLILQTISVLVAVVLRVCVFPRSEEYDDFEAGGSNHTSTVGSVQLEELKHSVTGRATPATNPESGSSFYSSSKRMSRSVSRRVEQKYGAFMHDGGGSRCSIM